MNYLMILIEFGENFNLGILTFHFFKVLGMDQDWRGGDIARYPGGGQKINILKNETVKYKDDKNLLVMFVDRSVNQRIFC